MCSVEGLREFINARLSAAAVEIFTVVEQTIVQYQVEVDAQRRLLDISWREETTTHTTGFRRQNVWKEDMCFTLAKKEPEPPQTQEDEDQVVVKQEADGFKVTAVHEQSEHRENFTTHDFVRKFTNEQLTAASVEIFTVFQQTIVQHQEENRAQLRLLDINLKPQIRLSRIDDPDQHICKEEHFFDQEINSVWDQREPEPPLVKEEPHALSTNLEGELLELKQEYDTVMVTLIDEHNDQSEPDSGQRLSQNSVTESQVQIKGQHQDLGSTTNVELELNKKHNSKNTNNSPISDIQCETDPSKKCLTCGFCGKTFQCISQLQRHHRIHTGEKPFQCKTCEKRFTDSSSLKKHRMIHTGEKPHPCETCGKCFYRQNHLLVHKRTHTGEKPYACEKCGKCFSQQSTVLTHMRTHTGEKPYFCETCGKRFSQQSSMLFHLRTHTGEKPHCCETCGKGFCRPDQLLAHKRTHNSNKAYSCETCGKNFSRQSNLLIHKRSHTGEKPFHCITCGKKFKDSSSLKQHSMIHTGEKRHYCLTCGKGFIQHSTLLIHMRSHTGEKPYSCMTCGKCFSQKSNLLVHMRTHTDEMLKTLKIPTHLLNPLL